MASKKFGLAILVMVLAFGMAVVGCDDGPANGNGTGTQPPGGNDPGGVANPFVGTWRANTGNEFVFRTNLTVFANWLGEGTYTFSGNTATVRFGTVSRSITMSGNSFIWQPEGITFVRQ